MATGSASKLARWRRCLKKAWYCDVKKLARKAKSIAPSRGTILHKSLENLYSGKDWVEPIRNMEIDLENVFDEERQEWMNLQKDLYTIMRGYIRAYKERDAGIKTLATELNFEVDLNGHKYTGTIDWIFEDATGVWIADHKTVKRIPEPEELYMDLQTLMYFDVARQLGYKPTGVMFNHIRTKPPTQPKVLKDGTISKAANIDTDVHTYFEAVRRAGLNVNDYADMVDKLKHNVFYKRTKIPISERTIKTLKEEAVSTLKVVDTYMRIAKEKGDEAETYFTRNMMKQRCSWDCEYFKLCFSELAGMDVSGLLEDEYEEREERYDDEKEED